MLDCTTPVADLLPHAPPMVLLDEVLGWDKGEVRVALLIRPGLPFYAEGKGVPAYVGLEYMAQACGVYAGLEAQKLNQPVRIGYLLGTRNYHSEVDWFQDGMRLIISGKEILREAPMGVFDCRIECNGAEVASAQLNLYQPESA